MLDEDKAQRETLLDRLCELAERRGEASHDAITDKSVRWELAPLSSLSDELREHDRLIPAVSLANWIQQPLRDLGRYLEDEELLSRFADRDGDALEAADAEQATALYSNLALTLLDLGDLPEARRRMERAIEIDEKHSEPDHPNLAIRFSNLAAILHALGDLPEARRQMERTIEIDEKHFESDHPKLAIRYSNLATILHDLGDLPEARRRMERAIEIEEKHFEPDHPILATTYNNLAYIRLAEGDRGKACGLWRRAYAIRKKHFDDDHLDVKATAEALRRHCGGIENSE